MTTIIGLDGFKLKTNIHQRINFRSWNCGFNFYLQSSLRQGKETLECIKYPKNSYPLYHAHYGKFHSKYPKY